MNLKYTFTLLLCGITAQAAEHNKRLPIKVKKDSRALVLFRNAMDKKGAKVKAKELSYLQLDVEKRMAEIEERIAQAKKFIARANESSVSVLQKPVIPVAIKLDPWRRVIPSFVQIRSAVQYTQPQPSIQQTPIVPVKPKAYYAVPDDSECSAPGASYAQIRSHELCAFSPTGNNVRHL